MVFRLQTSDDQKGTDYEELFPTRKQKVKHSLVPFALMVVAAAKQILLGHPCCLYFRFTVVYFCILFCC